MAEYGNPDAPGEWEFIKTYSPYQNIAPERSYPAVLFMTSTAMTECTWTRPQDDGLDGSAGASGVLL